MPKPVYCGSGCAKDGKHGPYMSLTFTREDLQKLMDNITKKGWCYATLKILKTPTNRRTHSIKLDTYYKDKEDQPEPPDDSDKRN